MERMFFSIYLIDHAWTYRIHEARAYLQELPQLVERMAALMEVKVEGCDHTEVIDGILREMWRLALIVQVLYMRGSRKISQRGSSFRPVWV